MRLRSIIFSFCVFAVDVGEGFVSSRPKVGVSTSLAEEALTTADGIAPFSPHTFVNEAKATTRTNGSSSNSQETETKNWSVDPYFGALAAVIITYAFAISPGQFGTDQENQLLQAFLTNPTAPEGVAPLFTVVFNELGVFPLIIAALVFPQASKTGLPAGPFTAATFFAGYFGLAPYLVFRAEPVESKTMSEMAFFPRLLENKFVNWGILALTMSIPFTCGAFTAGGLSSLLNGYAEMLSNSKLVSVSSADLVTLTLAAALLIRRDYKLRVDEENDDVDKTATLIAAATTLFPVLGAGLYCALRPPLPKE